MADIVISEFMDEPAVALLREGFSVHHDPTLADAPERIAAALDGARAIIVRNRTQVTAALVEAAPRLEAVGRLGVGLDNIDLAACKEHGVAVYPATGANSIAVAEYVMTAALMLLRGAYSAGDRVIAGEWPREALIGREISGKTMGLVGFGGIAREVAVCARALGMAVAAHDPFVPADDPAWDGVERLDLDALVSRADVVSLHVPLNDETRGLIGAERIAAMRPGAVIVNTARGGIVDEVALAEALGSGRLGGAALDVFAQEPLKAERGAMFAGVANLILTPHIAGVTEEANARVSRMTAETIIQALGAK